MWKIDFDDKAKKHLNRLDNPIKQRVLAYLDDLRFKEPRSFGKPLTANKKGLWRYRVGDYRIICDIRDKQVLILVIDIDHRSKIYSK